ncbi:23S rRNA (adenine(1618)-N(6))-methyltransferase RlmF [Vibrio sp. D420a]|nr:23S rRNA (adenine(1618)-N(6))-methyltransferase RlmF [Vibrio sp. D420a]MDK9763325.1 23S rRNA (adenine(1618)-N(6))-methyltransferase RlmF [Vibrio sp. D420a]
MNQKPKRNFASKNKNDKKNASAKISKGQKPASSKQRATSSKQSKAIKKSSQTTVKKPQVKSGLHPRNQHRGRYDFNALVKALPELKDQLVKNPVGESTINFSDPLSVKLLNKALLAHHYGVQHWDIPAGYLCPPIPGRADYIHRVADLLNSESQGKPYQHDQVKALDIGVGANCIYPIIGTTEYGWRYNASDVDPVSVKAANFIAESNPNLKGKIHCRLQHDSTAFFKGIIKENERYDVTTCNPPFHSSLEEAQKGTQRKLDNLAANRAKKQGKFYKKVTRPSAMASKQTKPDLNFGGQKAELWCPGGEAKFVTGLAKESLEFATQVLWFTTLISKKENVAVLKDQLAKLNAKEVKVVEMAQGQKISRFVAWSFMDKSQRQTWISLK